MYTFPGGSTTGRIGRSCEKSGASVGGGVGGAAVAVGGRGVAVGAIVSVVVGSMRSAEISMLVPLDLRTIELDPKAQPASEPASTTGPRIPRVGRPAAAILTNPTVTDPTARLCTASTSLTQPVRSNNLDLKQCRRAAK